MTMRLLQIDKVHPNPKQPRRHFDEETLRELAQSIQENGGQPLQPIVVEHDEAGGYLIVMGERRWRACKLNGNTKISAVIREQSNHDGRERLIMGIIENEQREDMDPIETAKAYEALMVKYDMKTGEIAQRVGKASTQIYNSLQLLKAEPEIQELWASHKITHEGRVVTAVLNLPAGKTRVRMAKRFAELQMTGKMIISASDNYLEMNRGRRKKSEKTPAIESVEKISGNLPEWNALFQLGKVPPFPLVNDTVMQTCDECALRSMASDKVCGTCALVSFLRGLEEVVHVR